MILSKSCEYAIRAAVYIAYKSLQNERTGIMEVADAIGSPVHFTAKILQAMVRKQVIFSNKGPRGGFYIKNACSLFLIDIITAIDGGKLFTTCVMGLQACSDLKPCPMHAQIKPLKDQLLCEFSKKSVKQMVYEYEGNRYFLK